MIAAALALVALAGGGAAAPFDLGGRLVDSADRLWRDGRFEASGEAAALAVAADPGSARALVALARFERGRGDDVAAAASLERALEVDRRHVAAARDLALLLARRFPGRAAVLLDRYLLDPPAGDDEATVAFARATARHLAAAGAGPGEPGRAPDRIALPVRRRGNSVLLDLRLEGRPALSFVLDSGTAALSIERAAAGRLPVEELAPGLSYGLGGLGRVDAALAVLERLRIADLELRRVPAYVGRFGTPHRAAGIAPLGLFEGYRLDLDVAAGRLELRRGDRAAGLREAPAVALWRVGSHYALRAVLAGHELTCLLDTGASAHVLELRRVGELLGEQARSESGRTRVQGVAGLTRALDLELLRGFEAGGRELPGRRALGLDLAAATTAAGVAVDCLLGAELLFAGPVAIDLEGAASLVLGP